jgi:hypothetical protein
MEEMQVEAFSWAYLLGCYSHQSDPVEGHPQLHIEAQRKSHDSQQQRPPERGGEGKLPLPGGGG